MNEWKNERKKVVREEMYVCLFILDEVEEE